MNNIDSLLKRVSSSIHHGEPNYFSFDPKSFQVICILCAKESAKLKKEKFNIINPELSNVEESSSQKIQMPENENSNHFCYKHKVEPSLFYYEECSQSICKVCFATEHHNHSSSTFDLISDVIKEKVDKLNEDLENLSKALKDNSTEFETKNKYFEDKK